MKKLFTVLLVAFLLMGCAKKEEDVVNEVPETITVLGTEVKVEGKLKSVLESGKLIISTSPPYAPNEYIDELSGEVKGCEMDLGYYIAEQLGVELVIESMDFDGCLIAVDTDKVDLSISGFGYKADRAEQYELSSGYYASNGEDHHTLIIKAENKDLYKTLEDFNKEGLVIDAQASSLQQMYVEDELPNAELVLFSDFSQGILDLSTGKVDAVALDYTTAKNYASTSNGEFISVYDDLDIEFDLSIYAGTEGNVMAAKKGETALMEVCNLCIAQVMSDGSYREWYLAACEESGVEPEL